MEFKIGDSESLKAIMSEAILRALDDATRERLIKEAIAHLIAPQEPYGGGYGKKRPSPLEEAYKGAVEHYARQTAREMLENDETVKAQVKAVLHDAMERAFVTHREVAVQRVADALAAGLWKRDE